MTLTLSLSHRVILEQALAHFGSRLSSHDVSDALQVLSSRHPDLPSITPDIVDRLTTQYRQKHRALIQRISQIALHTPLPCTADEVPFLTCSLAAFALSLKIPVPAAETYPSPEARITGLCERVMHNMTPSHHSTQMITHSV